MMIHVKFDGLKKVKKAENPTSGQMTQNLSCSLKVHGPGLVLINQAIADS